MNVYKLEAAIGLNSTEYQKGLKAAGESMSAMGDKIKAGAAAVGKATAAGLAAGSAAVTALAKSAVSAYADYEQLVGGVEKLFGESSDLLMMYAKDAANTAGMSVNAYMETATSFAAALTTSVQAAGGSMDEAVEYADTAMRDMSDNANTFGTDIASIQTAYQGFAKQNYTMLDNLKLGYGGTKAEMERLIEDANKLRHEQGINNDLTIESYADIITAIHEVQTQMNITGTTAREASKTISGSIGAVKAAWTNLTIEMAKDDGDIGGAFQAFGENVGAVVDNMLPRVEKAIGGIGNFIASAAPQVTNGLRKLLPKVLPSLVSTAGTLVSTAGSAILQAIPDLLTMGGGLLDSFVNNSQYIFKSAQQLMSNFANQLINVDYGKLGSSLSTIFTGAVNSVTDFLKGIDYIKVGKDIADFLNGIDWQGVANSLFDLIAAGIKAIPDIAMSFFANADISNIMTMIGLLGAPKLLGGITDFTGSGEGQSLGQAAGTSWSGAFMAGIKAFGLGWAIGSYLRDNIVIGDKTLGEWVEVGAEKLLGEIPDEGEFDDASNTGYINYKGKVMAVNPNSQVYKTYNPSGYADWLQNEATNGEYYTEHLVPRVEGDVAGQYPQNLKAKPVQKDERETFKYYYNGKLNSAYKRDVYGRLTEEWLKYGGIAFGGGGRVTKPTFALVGEKEPETIIPDSKRGEFGNTYNTEVHIHIDGTGKNADEIADEAIEIVSSKLSFLGITQQRAVGGKSWA